VGKREEAEGKGGGGGKRGEMTQTLYAHMNKTNKKKINEKLNYFISKKKYSSESYLANPVFILYVIPTTNLNFQEMSFYKANIR
jgi:hypothetical protein